MQANSDQASPALHMQMSLLVVEFAVLDFVLTMIIDIVGSSCLCWPIPNKSAIYRTLRFSYLDSSDIFLR